MKQVKREDLVVGRRYWIVQKGLKTPEHRHPLLFIGFKSKPNLPWFTFGSSVEAWKYNFNFTPSSSAYKFYNQEDFV